VSGTFNGRTGKESFKAEWSGDEKSAQKLLKTGPLHAPLNLSHNGNGKTVDHTAKPGCAIRSSSRCFTGYRVERKLCRLSQKVKANGTRETW